MALSTFLASGSLAAGRVVSGASDTTADTDTVAARFAIASGDGAMNYLGQTNTTGAQQVYISTLSVDTSNEL